MTTLGNCVHSTICARYSAVQTRIAQCNLYSLLAGPGVRNDQHESNRSGI